LKKSERCSQNNFKINQMSILERRVSSKEHRVKDGLVNIRRNQNGDKNERNHIQRKGWE
jgi:hypothetical protein